MREEDFWISGIRITSDNRYEYKYRNGWGSDRVEKIKSVPKMNVWGNMRERFRLLLEGHVKAAFVVDPNITKYLRNDKKHNKFKEYCDLMVGNEHFYPLRIKYDLDNRFQKKFDKVRVRTAIVAAKTSIQRTLEGEKEERRAAIQQIEGAHRLEVEHIDVDETLAQKNADKGPQEQEQVLR